jgi:hypothetical protein
MKDLYLWINAQIDTIKNCVSVLDEKRENVNGLIVQLWALKKHIDAMIDFLERNRKYGTHY